MRKTKASVPVAMALLGDPTAKHWGYELSKLSGVRSGVLYPMLTRMLDEGWLTDGWEDPTTIVEKRPPRRYYELTDHGRLALGALLAEARSDARFAGLQRMPGPRGRARSTSWTLVMAARPFPGLGPGLAAQRHFR